MDSPNAQGRSGPYNHDNHLTFIADPAGTIFVSAPVINEGSGDLVFAADAIRIGGEVSTQGQVILQPLLPDTSIGIAGAAGGLQISQASITNVTAAQLVNGQAAGQHEITVTEVIFPLRRCFALRWGRRSLSTAP